MAMDVFQVKLFPNGKWDRKIHVEIEADSAKDAAEKLYGKPLSATGTNDRLRAWVRYMDVSRGTAVEFYER